MDSGAGRKEGIDYGCLWGLWDVIRPRSSLSPFHLLFRFPLGVKVAAGALARRKD